MTAATNRTCQVDACSQRVPAILARHSMCLSHYLDAAFTRTASALQICQQGHPIEPQVLDWLVEQGELAVQLLSREDEPHSQDERSRLLELLLCLTNIQEYVRHHSVSKVVS